MILPAWYVREQFWNPSGQTDIKKLIYYLDTHNNYFIGL